MVVRVVVVHVVVTCVCTEVDDVVNAVMFLLSDCSSSTCSSSTCSSNVCVCVQRWMMSSMLLFLLSDCSSITCSSNVCACVYRGG